MPVVVYVQQQVVELIPCILRVIRFGRHHLFVLLLFVDGCFSWDFLCVCVGGGGGGGGGGGVIAIRTIKDYTINIKGTRSFENMYCPKRWPFFIRYKKKKSKHTIKDLF